MTDAITEGVPAQDKPIPKPDLDHLDQFIKDHQGSIHLDKSYNHLPEEEALKKMVQQAQLVVTDYRKLGMTDEKIQNLLSNYLLASPEKPT